MRNKKILVLIISTIFLTACSPKIQLRETSGEASTIYENDNIKIKISNNINERENVCKVVQEDLQKINDFSPIENIKIEISKVYVVPDTDNIIKCDDKFIGTEEFKKELIKKSYGIYDNWIVEGLYGNIFDIDVEDANFSGYYENHDFSLFGARFFEPFSSKEEIENIKSASINLVEYLLKNDKKAELLKNNIEISDMENWAMEKNINLDYQRKIESLMNRMEVLNKTSQLIINTKEEINGFKIDIAYTDKINEQYDTAEKIEHIILRFDKDILNIKQGIKKDAPNFYADYKEVLNKAPKVEYIFDKNIGGGICDPPSARIYLGDMTCQAHEYCHMLFYTPFTKKGIVTRTPGWWNEGIANYLDVVYSEAYIESLERDLYSVSIPVEDSLGGLFVTDDQLKEFQALADDELKVLQNLYDNILNIISENNINVNNIDEIAKDKNKRMIVNHIFTLATYKSHKDIYGMKGTQLDLDLVLKGQTLSSGSMNEGDTMNYLENFSFVNYLTEEYGLEKILYLNVADFNQLTYEEVFGKSFKKLKIDWMNYFKENIKDIELIL